MMVRCGKWNTILTTYPVGGLCQFVVSNGKHIMTNYSTGPGVGSIVQVNSCATVPTLMLIKNGGDSHIVLISYYGC
jgi:hypothetical protein